MTASIRTRNENKGLNSTNKYNKKPIITIQCQGFNVNPLRAICYEYYAFISFSQCKRHVSTNLSIGSEVISSIHSIISSS